MAIKDQGPEIDTEVAACTGQDDALKHAMMGLGKFRKSRQTAPETKPGPKAKPKAARPRLTGGPDRSAPPTLVPEIVDDSHCGSTNGISDPEDMPEINIKDHLTEKEQLFIEIFLAGGCSRMEAMISAGYTEGNLDSNHYRARKIISKYESLAGEHKKTFRAVGAGEVAVAQGLLALATTAKSEMVRLNAWTAIGKILGLTQDVVAVNQGIQIIIKGRGDDSGRPAVQVRQEASKAIPRTMAITK